MSKDAPGIKELDQALRVIIEFIEDSRERLIVLERRVGSIDAHHESEWELAKGADL